MSLNKIIGIPEHPRRADQSAVICIKLRISSSPSVGARVVERGWEGLDGRPWWGGDRLPPRREPREQDAGDHQGPPHIHSTTLAPTDHPASFLTSRLRLMRITAHLSALRGC